MGRGMKKAKAKKAAGGRPPKRDGVSRTALVSVRLSPAELAALDRNAAAADLPRTAFALAALRRGGAFAGA
jgi:hypothetical protein